MITRDVHQAVAHLRSGNLVAIPTETVYGLAAVASNESAIRRVFEAKARPFFDPLIVHISSWPELDSLVESVSEIERHLLEAFWPGPLTLVSAKRGIVSDLITSGHPSVAVRMPAHPLCQELLKLLGEPVVAPSANQFGRTSPTTAEHVVSEFKESDNVLVLDGGECTVGIESTIIRCEGESVSILRPGGVSRAMLEESLRAGGFPCSIIRTTSSVSPGHLKHHYQPRKTLYVYERLEHLKEAGVEEAATKFLELPSEAVLAARTLYGLFRQADLSDAKTLALKWNFPRDGEWEALWDRVQRAATVIC